LEALPFAVLPVGTLLVVSFATLLIPSVSVLPASSGVTTLGNDLAIEVEKSRISFVPDILGIAKRGDGRRGYQPTWELRQAQVRV